MSDLALSTSERLRRYPSIRAIGDADLCRQAARIFEAAELIRLGGRAGLVSHVTGLEKTTVNRLYRQLQGVPSPPGQAPFTDAWYLENELRMLHASVVWYLYQGLVRTGRSDARVLIDVYQAYKYVVPEPLLDLMRAAFVPQLVDMNHWEERKCKHCFTAYLAPLESNGSTCPGCNLYFRHRCRMCGGPINVHARGRRRRVCETCK
ncbi:MAG TPA: FlhC family transcriptional regulator [Gammaproteobacteria bacterium]